MWITILDVKQLKTPLLHSICMSATMKDYTFLHRKNCRWQMSRYSCSWSFLYAITRTACSVPVTMCTKIGNNSLLRIVNNMVQSLSLYCFVVLCWFCKRTELGISLVVDYLSKRQHTYVCSGEAAGLKNFSIRFKCWTWYQELVGQKIDTAPGDQL